LKGKLLEKIYSGIDGEDTNSDKSVQVGENIEGEITGNNIAREKLNKGKWPQEGEEEDLNIRKVVAREKFKLFSHTAAGLNSHGHFCSVIYLCELSHAET
jgi:hypothetical protein